MFKKLKTFLTLSLAALTTMNIAKAEELKQESYDGLSTLAKSIDNPDSNVVKTSRKINSSTPKVFKKVLGASCLVWGLFNCIPLLTRVFTGKAEFDDIPIRFRGSQDNEILNYSLDVAQVLVPLFTGAYLLKPEKKKFERSAYQKNLLDVIFGPSIEKTNSHVAPTININVNNYYRDIN